jgi:hypothetical protein
LLDFNFLERPGTSTGSYQFNGPGNRDCNVISIDNYNDGAYRIFNKFTCVLNDGSTVNTQESFTVGDDSTTWKYGQREFQFDNNFLSTTTAGSSCSDLLSYSSVQRDDLKLRAQFTPHLSLYDRVTVDYQGQPGGNGARFGYAHFGVDLFSGPIGGIKISSKDFYIIGMTIDLNGLYTDFHLLEA